MPSRPDDEREALLAAIAAEPGSDRPLEVYADWLVERGAPLGELIHIQLALAAAGADEARAAELVAHERRLLREHEQILAGGHYHPDVRWRYARGLFVGLGHRGLFRAPPPRPEDNAIWLRFLPDGNAKVVWFGEHARPVQVVGAPGGKGRYELAEVAPDTMRITATMQFENVGNVDYDCRLRAGRLEVDIASHINGWTHHATFELVHTGDVDTRDALE